MNVLLVWNGPANEAERSVLARREVPLLRELAKQGVRATVALFGDGGGLRHELEDAGIDVRFFPTPLAPVALTLGRLPSAVMRLRRLLKQLDPDVSEGLEPMPAIALGLAKRSGGGVVLYRRQHPRGRARLNLASRVAAKLADGTIVSCEAMRQSAAADDRTPLDRIDVATTGVAESRAVLPSEIADARRSLGIAAGARVIGVVSRLRREKGIDVLIRALDHLAVDNAHVLIAGTGPEESHLRELAARAPIPIHFLGHRNDGALWYALSDVIAIPSTRESFGRTTVEAMAAGRPLIAARVGGLAEAVIDGETGLLVPPENSEALAAALRRLLGDNDTLRRCGEAARARFETCFTIEHMATARRQAWERALRR